MYQTYRGQVRNGLPIVESAALPENAKFIITIVDEPFDIEGAEKELIAKLAEAAIFKTEEGEEHNTFFERLMVELNEKV